MRPRIPLMRLRKAPPPIEIPRTSTPGAAVLSLNSTAHRNSPAQRGATKVPRGQTTATAKRQVGDDPVRNLRIGRD